MLTFNHVYVGVEKMQNNRKHTVILLIYENLEFINYSYNTWSSFVQQDSKNYQLE